MGSWSLTHRVCLCVRVVIKQINCCRIIQRRRGKNPLSPDTSMSLSLPWQSQTKRHLKRRLPGERNLISSPVKCGTFPLFRQKRRCLYCGCGIPCTVTAGITFRASIEEVVARMFGFFSDSRCAAIPTPDSQILASLTEIATITGQKRKYRIFRHYTSFRS